MTLQDLRNDGFTIMKRENINIMATEFHIQKGDWNYKQIIPYNLINDTPSEVIAKLEEGICYGAMKKYKEDHNGPIQVGESMSGVSV